MAFSLALGVTTESLKSKSSEVSSDIEAMNTDIQKLITEVSETAQYWLGEAGDAQRAKLDEQVEVLNNMVERLRTYPTRLLKIAGLYEDAEEENVSTAAATKTDIVMV